LRLIRGGADTRVRRVDHGTLALVQGGAA
jgi:hypothetical protein